eukprot:6470456-Amphidinium_carterae.2
MYPIPLGVSPCGVLPAFGRVAQCAVGRAAPRAVTPACCLRLGVSPSVPWACRPRAVTPTPSLCLGVPPCSRTAGRAA